MDNASSLRRLPSPLDSPCPSFGGSRSEVGLKLEKVVCLSHQLAKTAILERYTERFKEVESVLVIEFDQLRLNLSRNNDRGSALLLGKFPKPVDHLVALGEIGVGYIGRINHLLSRQETKRLDGVLFVFVKVGITRRLIIVQYGSDLLKGLSFLGIGLAILLDS